MFNKIKEEIKSYAEQYNMLKKVYVDKNKELKANFISRKFDEEFTANHADYNKAVLDLQTESRGRISTVFEQLTVSIRASVTADLGSEMIAELTLIKDMKLSEFEIKGYAEKYTGNPKALRILKGIAEQNGITFIYTSYDDILVMMKELHHSVTAFINSYQGDYRTFGFYSGDYEHAVMLAGDPIDLAEDKYNDFMNPFKGSASNG